MTNKLLVVVLVLCVAAVVLSGLSFAKVNSQGATLEAQGEQLSSLVEAQAPANNILNNIKNVKKNISSNIINLVITVIKQIITILI